MNNSIFRQKNILSNIWLKITVSGIHNELAFKNVKKLKVINNLSLWILIVLLLTNVRWYVMNLPEFMFLNIVGIMAMISVIFLNSKGRYQLAKLFFFIYIPLHITLLGMVLPFGFELFFFPIMIIAGFIFEKRRVLFIYVVLLTVSFVFLKVNTLDFLRIETPANYLMVFYLLSTILSLLLCFLSISLFIRQYEENTSEILIKNEMLKESAILSKDKADYKSLLLREMNHRIKNNLQLISSLLNIQSQKFNDVTVKKALQDAKFRVHSIALIHKQLYKDKDINTVNIDKYIVDLLHNIGDTVPEFSEEIDFEYKCDNFDIGVDNAVSIGLIINELITNSIQHGFSEGDEKKILLDVRKTEEDLLLITIEDSGFGLNKSFNAANKGFGFELIETLAMSYNGSIEIGDTRNKVSVKLNLNRGFE